MSKTFGRRKFIQATGAATAALAFPYIRTSNAAGSLSVGFWDHWVPGANDTLTRICNDWAAKEKVALKIDYITTQGNKLQLSATAESQAKAGHDVLAFLAWDPLDKQKSLEPMDDVIAHLEKQYGKIVPAMEYLGKTKGHWIAVPGPTGTQVKPPCARLDVWKQAPHFEGRSQVSTWMLAIARHRVEERPHRHHRARQRQALRLEPRHVEQVVEQPERAHPAASPLDTWLLTSLTPGWGTVKGASTLGCGGPAR